MAFFEVHYGQSRIVFLVGRIAIKFPIVKRVSVLSPAGQIAQGRSCNRAERHAWIEQVFPHLCPMLWADSLGWLVVMLRAEPMTSAEFDEWFNSDRWPHVPFKETPYELDGKDAGTLPDGRCVMIDYGMRGYQDDDGGGKEWRR